jgi:hypothetical protein
MENRKRWNTDKLDETEVQCHYQQEIKKELQGKPPSNDREEEWTYIKEVITTSAQNVPGEKQNERNEEWYDQECREMIKAEQQARFKCIQCNTRASQEEYNKKRISAARVCRRKKREAPKGKVDAIVEHHTKNESKKFHKRIQEVTQKFKPSINVCRSKDGKILTENEDV